MTEPIPSVVGKAHLQAAYLVELILRQQQDEIPGLIREMPEDELPPLLGAAVILAAEVLRAQRGAEARALKQLDQIRQYIGENTVSD